MYTHARQFPHLAGLNDQQIRALARNAMAKRPRYALIIRLRNAVVIASMLLATAALNKLAGTSIGLSLMIVGAICTAFVMAWNLVWVNTVMWRITREEMKAG